MQKAVSIALVDNEKIFVIKRESGYVTGVYSFPGGRVEEGETLEEAALRELYEETGLTCTISSVLTRFQVRDYDLTCFLGHSPKGVACETAEASHPHYVALSELRHYKTTEGLYAVATKALSKRFPNRL